MGISKITRNYQITLPKDVRKIINVKEGDEVMFIVDSDKVLLTRPKEDPVMAAAGIWKGIKETGVEYQKRVRAGWKKRQKQLDW